MHRCIWASVNRCIPKLTLIALQQHPPTHTHLRVRVCHHAAWACPVEPLAAAGGWWPCCAHLQNLLPLLLLLLPDLCGGLVASLCCCCCCCCCRLQKTVFVVRQWERCAGGNAAAAAWGTAGMLPAVLHAALLLCWSLPVF
jgi:hypothetical protein